MDEEKYKVLYVDDEENNLISFRAAFRRNYEIFTATSAAEGIELLKQHVIPIIITGSAHAPDDGDTVLRKDHS
jgi:response regulator RpfG family c-di-GMP phosphodiesterase